MTALGICAALTLSGSKMLYKIGVHVALLLQVVFCFVFTLQAKKAYGDPNKSDRLVLFIV